MHVRAGSGNIQRDCLWDRRLEMGLLNRFATPFREFGFWAGLLYVVGRGLHALSPRLNLYVYELMVQPIPEKALLPDRLSKGFEIRQIKQNDPEIDRMPARTDIKEARFAQDALCLGAFRKGQFIGYLWLCFDEYDEDEVRCRYVLSPRGHAVFDFDLYIFPEHRMGLGFVGIWNAVNKYLHQRGIEFTFSRLTRFNLPSRRAHAHLGWKRVASAVFLQAWNLEVMIATTPPFLHASANRMRSVRLNLSPDALRPVQMSGGT